MTACCWSMSFGQRPDDAQKVKQFVLDTIASDPGLQQTELVFLGLFGARMQSAGKQECPGSSPVPLDMI